MKRRDFLAGAAASITAAPGFCQQPDHVSGQNAAAARRHTAEERYAMFRKNLELRGNAITNNQFRDIRSLEDWKRRRPEIKRQFLDTLGLDPLPARTPLNARITGGFEREDYRVENIVFESMPGLYVTGNLYLPKTGAGSKSPAILYVSGHSPGLFGAKVDYQRHGVWFAENGFTAFLLDTIEFGEIPGIHHGTHDLEMWYWLSLGYTPAAVEVWNAIRALDYLETRKEVDTTRFGMTGRSGGGAITWFTAAADDRIKAASPVHGTWSVGPHIAEEIVRENCDCIYFWNPYLLDLSSVGALIAPRPLKIVNASKDGAFTPNGYHKVFELLKPVYEWHGKADAVAEFDLPTGHADVPPYRKAANEWLSRWLTGQVIPFDESTIKLDEPKRLKVLSTLPANSRNEGIHKDFIRTHRMRELKSLADWQRRRGRIITDLKEKVFRAFPDRRMPFDVWKNPERGWSARYTDSFNVEFATEESVRVHGQLFVPRNGRKNHPALIYVKDRADIVYGVDYDNILSAFENHVVLVLKPRAVDYPMDNYRLATTKMSAGLLGTTLESLQLWDILRSVDYLIDEENLNLPSISVYGRNNMSALAIYAGALDDRITRVILDNPPASHWQGPAFLNVLRYTDIPEVAATLAPRELVSLTRFPAEFQRTKAIFALYDKARQMREARAIGDALRVWEQKA
jgi:cephalosporin-C deacetylase-like acetyl esterase